MAKRNGWRWKRRCPKKTVSDHFRGIHNSVTLYETIGGMKVPVGARCLWCKDVTQVPRYEGQDYTEEP